MQRSSSIVLVSCLSALFSSSIVYAQTTGDQSPSISNVEGEITINYGDSNYISNEPLLEISNVIFTRKGEFDVIVRNTGDNDLVIHEIIVRKISQATHVTLAPLYPSARYHIPVDDIPIGGSKSVNISFVVNANSADRFLISLHTEAIYELEVTLVYNNNQRVSFTRSTYEIDFSGDPDNEHKFDARLIGKWVNIIQPENTINFIDEESVIITEPNGASEKYRYKNPATNYVILSQFQFIWSSPLYYRIDDNEILNNDVLKIYQPESPAEGIPFIRSTVYPKHYPLE